VLNHFLERTRCPTAFVEVLATPWGAAEPSVPEGPSPLAQTRDRVAALLARARRAGHDASLLDEVERTIERLRHERYLDNSITESEQTEFKALVRKAYYLLRPALPVSLRKHLQRAALRDWESIAFPRWPVDTSVEDLIDTVWRMLLRVSGQDELPFIWYWPEGHTSACIMTHDVETSATR
jgi:hypothetical protein